MTQRYLRNISEYPFILGHLPPATRRRTLKPLKLGGADDIQVQLSMEVVDGEVVTQTVVVSQMEEEAKVAAEAEAKARAEAETAAAAAAEVAAAAAAEAAEAAAAAAAAAAAVEAVEEAVAWSSCLVTS